MRARDTDNAVARPSSWLSITIFLAALALMVVLKVQLYPERYIALGYALPLLVCLWHRDRRLLWAMAVSFVVLSGLKAFVIPTWKESAEDFRFLQWLMQLTNIGVVAITVHTILNLTDRLRAKNRELRAANQELAARGEEISRQNVELQAQSEELVQQNEELQQQGEELGRQNEELQQQAEELGRQSEELQRQAQELMVANRELNQRESVLQTLLGCLGGPQTEPQMLERVCQAVIDIFDRSGMVSAVLERTGDELALLTQAGSIRVADAKRPFAGSFASVVMEHDRTAFVDDLAARPDLRVSQPARQRFRSVLATPLRLGGKPVGVVKVYSFEPRKWTRQEFRVIEWVAAQCSLALGIMRLQEDLGRTNARLEEQVRRRTASLEEMVNELEHFSYTITHDMRAPLRAIRGFIGTLEELVGGRVEEECKFCLERIANSAERMDRLITDALSYSKTVRSELALAPVDSARLLHGIIESYPNLQAPHAEIVMDGEMPVVLANEAGLTQCFSNLLDNATKFVEAGTLPKVSVRAVRRDGWVRFWFEDNGIGIPETFQPRLFQMFQRANRTYEGTGIGLALVRKVAERMGGRVGVESGEGLGSRFWVELKPCASDRDGHVGTLVPQTVYDAAEASNGRNADFRAGSILDRGPRAGQERGI